MKRIKNYNPQIKLIILLRNPIERAFSHWNMQRDRNREPLEFLEAVAQEKERIEQALPLQPRGGAYIDRGFYFEQMKRVFRFFPREQVHVIKFDDFRNNWHKTVNSVFEFLGVESSVTLKNREQNLIPYERRMTVEERLSVYEIYRSDITRLEELLNWDCSDWKPV